jgi:hypothetical protein
VTNFPGLSLYLIFWIGEKPVTATLPAIGRYLVGHYGA